MLGNPQLRQFFCMKMLMIGAMRRGPLIPSHRSLNRNRDIGNGLATDRNGTEGWNASFARRSRTTNGRIHRLVDDGRMEGFRGYWMQWAGRL